MKIQQWLFKLLRKQNVTDGRTHGHTDGQTDKVKTVYPLQTKFAGGIKKQRNKTNVFKGEWDLISAENGKESLLDCVKVNIEND